MSILEMQVDALMRLCTAETDRERQLLAGEVRGLLARRRMGKGKSPEALIRELLLELGAPDHLLGHPYVVRAVLLVLEDRSYIHNITFGLYPKLADLFDTRPSRVERAIRHLVEVVWTRGDMDVLDRYFGNTVQASRGKPTNGEFLARISNVVRERMQEGEPVQ